jgi:hypothetical protein
MTGPADEVYASNDPYLRPGGRSGAVRLESCPRRVRKCCNSDIAHPAATAKISVDLGQGCVRWSDAYRYVRSSQPNRRHATKAEVTDACYPVPQTRGVPEVPQTSRRPAPAGQLTIVVDNYAATKT